MVRDYHRSAAENVGIGADAGDAAVTGSVFHAVAPVSAVYAAFRTQPSAYPPEVPKSDVAPTCGSVRQGYSTEAGAPAGGFRRRNEPQAAKQDKAAGSCAPRGGHICPRCGQFRGFARAFQTQRKTAEGRCRMKKAHRFKENGGVPTKITR